MNTIDNGISKVLKIIKKRVIRYDVIFIDHYGKKRIKRFNSDKNLTKRSWTE